MYWWQLIWVCRGTSRMQPLASVTCTCSQQSSALSHYGCAWTCAGGQGLFSFKICFPHEATTTDSGFGRWSQTHALRFLGRTLKKKSQAEWCHGWKLSLKRWGWTNQAPPGTLLDRFLNGCDLHLAAEAPLPKTWTLLRTSRFRILYRIRYFVPDLIYEMYERECLLHESKMKIHVI